MASGTINGSCDNSRYILTCEWTSTANTNANTSSVTAKVYLNGNGYTTSSSYWSCVINGTTVTSNKSANIGGKTLLGSRTWTVNHNNDGTASVGISFSYSNGLSSSGTYTTKTGSGSATVKLDTIARGSSMSLSRSSATIGSDSVTVNITRNSSAYKHKVKLILGGTTYLLAENVDTSYTFTPSMSYCNKITTSTSGTATVKVETLTGTNGSWIAETTKTLTLNVPSSVVPSVGISVTANNQTSGVNVAGKTTFTVKPTNASGSYGSTIKSYSITGGHLNGTSSSGATTGTLGAGDYTFVVKVTDSRGRTAQASQKVTVHAYSSPTISARAFRCDSKGTESSSGAYIAVNFSWEITNLASNNSNAKQYFIQYKTNSATSYTTSVDWTNLSSYSGSMTKVLSQTFSTTSSYNIQLKVKDSFGTTTSTLDVSTISALLNIEKSGVGVGKIHEKGVLDVGGQLHTTSEIYSGNSVYIKTDPNGKVRFGYHEETTDTFIANTTNNWLRLKADKTMTYAGYKIYTSYEKPTPADIGASKALTTINGYQGFTLNDGTTSNWIRTTTSGIIPYQTADSSWDSANSALGTSAWRFANGYVKEVYCNGLKNDLGDLWLSSKPNDSNSAIYIQSKWLCPSSTVYSYLGSSGYRWHTVWASNGTIQTSDERFKVKQGFTDIEECYEMVKDTDIYNYVMLNQNKEDLTKNRLGKLALSNSQEQVNIHMGIMAQDIQKYKCSKQILVEGNYERADGSTDTMLSVNPYGLTTAVMGALKVEIQKRELLEEKITKLESLIEQSMTQLVK
jgi:hypothetical protein